MQVVGHSIRNPQLGWGIRTNASITKQFFQGIFYRKSESTSKAIDKFFSDLTKVNEGSCLIDEGDLEDGVCTDRILPK